MQTFQQRSPEWFLIRNGKFTAFDIYRLLGKEGLKLTQQSIENYAFEKAVEVVCPDNFDEDVFLSKDVAEGKANEPFAFAKFKELMAYNFKIVCESGFFECPGFESDAGATPDGLVDDDETLEIKCPNKKNFLKVVAFGISEVETKWLAQIQMQLLCTGRKRCNLFLYRTENGIEMWHHIVIERCEETIALIKLRLNQAIKIKYDCINFLTEKKQY